MNTIGLAFRLILSLSVVVGIMWVAARVLRKKVGVGGGSKRHKGDLITVVARKGVSKNAAVAVVQVGDQVLVLGITEHNVNVLSEADPALVEPIDLLQPMDQTANSARSSLRSGRMLLPAPDIDLRGPAKAWKLLLDSLRDRTVRR
jgi:flagellar protein FliO/FliZ